MNADVSRFRALCRFLKTEHDWPVAQISRVTGLSYPTIVTVMEDKVEQEFRASTVAIMQDVLKEHTLHPLQNKPGYTAPKREQGGKEATGTTIKHPRFKKPKITEAKFKSVLKDKTTVDPYRAKHEPEPVDMANIIRDPIEKEIKLMDKHIEDRSHLINLNDEEDVKNWKDLTKRDPKADTVIGTMTFGQYLDGLIKNAPDNIKFTIHVESK